MWQRVDDCHEVNFDTMELRTATNKVFTLTRTMRPDGVSWRADTPDGLVLQPFMVVMLFESKIELMFLTWALEKDLLA
jgi:hypothetical protein